MKNLNLTYALVAFATMSAGSYAQTVGTVFIIPLENHNWTQPSSYNAQQQIFGNAAAPYINSLVTPGNANAVMVSFASNYQNVAAGIHPSEPNYLWSEAGTNFGILNDNDPYPSNVQSTSDHLCGYLQALGISWRSYQEDTDLMTNSSNQLTYTPVSPNQYTVPLSSFSGSSPAYTNEYNGSHYYAYAAKHNPQAFFTDTNGGDNVTSGNPLSSHYAPLQQLESDLANNTVARFNWITPDLYNEMHTPLPGGFVYHGTTWSGDQAAVAEGDNFLSIIIPRIMASAAFQNNGVIVIWNDETEGGDSSQFTISEIIISPLAKGNGYTNTIKYTHSSDLLTWQEVLAVGPGGGFGDAQNATDLSDLFQAGAIPSLAQAVAPSAYTLAPGTLISGTLASLASFDQSYLQIQPAATSSLSQAPDQLVLTGTSPLSSVSDLRFDLVSHANEANIGEKIELYNWTAGAYVLMDSRNSLTTDSPVEVRPSNPNQFIQTGTNAVRARVSWRAVGALTTLRFTVSVNQTLWKVSP